MALRSRVEQEQEAKAPAPEPGAAPSNEDYSDDDDVLAPSGGTTGGEPGAPPWGCEGARFLGPLSPAAFGPRATSGYRGLTLVGGVLSRSGT